MGGAWDAARWVWNIWALVGLWGLAALMWVCNKMLCLGEIPSPPILSLLGLQCPGRGTDGDAAGSPSGQSCCPRGLQWLWTMMR